MWQPSEANTYSDVEACFEWLRKEKGTREEDIILYGQSVGSGPTCDLASRRPHLRGVILHSPILSGVRVLYEVKRTYWFDVFKVKALVLSLLQYKYRLSAGSWLYQLTEQVR